MAKFKLPENKRIPELEQDALSFWQKNEIFEKSIEQRSEDNLYVFYDGPPFISGLPHYGHLLGSIAKDIIPRYQTMRGKRVERLWGWDAHGLTVENKVQQRLDIKERRDIETFGLAKFTEECYRYTSEISGEWEWYIDKIGRWVDMKNAYKTTDKTYMESVIWAFKQLYDKGLIYEGVRTSLYCTTCGTPVSNFEIAMDNTYKDVEDPSVTIKFKVKTPGKFESANILAWTTTPWTLPSNRALVVDDNEEYVLVEGDGEKYIVGQKRLQEVFSDNVPKVLESFRGAELVGLEYAPLYDFYLAKEGEFKVYSYEGMVHMEEGTGIVHSAPGFGEIDTEMGRHFNLTIMQTINDEGHFIQGDAGTNPFVDMYYAKANKYIMGDLQERGLLFKEEEIVHRFPYHDRCNTLLIQRAQNSWFVKIQDLREKLIKNNEPISWVPEHLKKGRFEKGIESAPDWCISRTRFWATPMPVWESEDGDRIVVGSIKELEELSGQQVKDLHRPYIDEITIEKDGKVYTRRPEVLDSWFEAGSMPYAQVHYPFENQEKFEKTFPGDFIVEYIAQVRAWFYVTHVLSTALFDSNAFKNVVSTGVMAGNDGRKMSKTYGNYTDPKEILENIGGDALRLYLMNSPLMMGGNANFDETELKNKLNNVLNPLWNSLKFFLIYAVQQDWSPKNASEVAYSSENQLDKWILVRLHQAIKLSNDSLDRYLVPQAVQPLEDFIDDLSKWYVRRSRDRIAAGDNAAMCTLYTVLLSFAKAAAPAIPFISENIYQHLVSADEQGAETSAHEESVHLCVYPESNEDFILQNQDLLQKMQNTRDIVSLALSVRVQTGIKVRQPLSTLYVQPLVIGESGSTNNTFDVELIKDEVNVKAVGLIDENTIPSGGEVLAEDRGFRTYLDTTVTEDLKIEGTAREIVRKLQDLRKAQGLAVSDRVKATYIADEVNAKAVELFGTEIKDKVQALSLEAASEFTIEKV
jgi:isoleucyl-tRNA synthetase